MIVHSSRSPIILNEIFGFGKNKEEKPISKKEYNKKIDPKYNALDNIPFEKFEGALKNTAANIIRSKYYKPGEDKPENFGFKYKNINVDQNGQPVITIQILNKGKVVGSESVPVELRT